MASLWKLIALMALVLMPFGMAAPAMAHSAPQAAAAHHCGGEQPAPSGHGSRGPMADCSMCTALPADEARDDPPIVPAMVPVIAPAFAVEGILPEIVPPPPRIA